MADYNINLTIQNIWSIVRIAIDIGVVWFIIYYAIKFVRNNNRTIQIFKGIIMVLLLNAISKLLGLATLEYISDTVISWGFLAVIIIFQPEIRGALERIGKTNSFSKVSTLLTNEKEALVEQVYQATVTLSASRTGALISIEQGQSLQDYIKTGIDVNAKASKELLCSIFMTTTPLHDGAVIIQGDKIACASAYFPPTSVNLSSRYGARHRAALGMSEVSDALTIVVSEETSAISIAEHGQIFNVTPDQLKDYLRRVILGENVEISKNSRNRNILNISDEPEMIIEKLESRQQTSLKDIFRKMGTPSKELKPEKVESSSELDMKVPLNNRFKYMSEDEKKTLEEKQVDTPVKTTPKEVKTVVETNEAIILDDDDIVEIEDNTQLVKDTLDSITSEVDSLANNMKNLSVEEELKAAEMKAQNEETEKEKQSLIKSMFTKKEDK